MAEPTLRVIVVAAAVAVALLAALMFRSAERGRVRRAPLDLAPLPPGVTLFSDSGCRRCDDARSLLEEADIAFAEISFDRDREVAEAVGVVGVPVVVVKGDDGSEVDRIVGKPSKREIRRLREVAIGD